jgi:hypothetical protein
MHGRTFLDGVVLLFQPSLLQVQEGGNIERSDFEFSTDEVGQS